MGVFLLTHRQTTSMVDALDRIALLRRLANRLEQRCERFLRAEYGLSWPQFQVLKELSVDKPTMLQQVNDAVYCTRGNLAAIVDRLERDGWVVRLRRQGDRRVVLLGLTERGAQVREIEARLTAEMTEWLEPVRELSEPISTNLTRMLQDLVDPLSAREDAPSAEVEVGAVVETPPAAAWLVGDA